MRHFLVTRVPVSLQAVFGRNKSYQNSISNSQDRPFDIYYYPRAGRCVSAARSRSAGCARQRGSGINSVPAAISSTRRTSISKTNAIRVAELGTGRHRALRGRYPPLGAACRQRHGWPELVHAVQSDILARTDGTGENARTPPLWLSRAAEYLSSAQRPNTAMWLRDAVRRKSFPHRHLTTNSFRIAGPALLVVRRGRGATGHRPYVYYGGRDGKHDSHRAFHR